MISVRKWYKYKMTTEMVLGIYTEFNGGGTHMLRHTGMCHPHGLLFHQKYLDMWSHFAQNPYGRVPFHKNCEKMVKSAVFETEKPLEMGLNMRKFRKNCLISRFLSEKNPRAAHSVKK